LFPDGKKALQFGRIINHDNKKIIAGTYGRRRSEYSRGLFIAELHEDKKDVKYYNYADLTNFFEYMKSTLKIQLRILHQPACSSHFRRRQGRR
jgi:hypothetical protein